MEVLPDGGSSKLLYLVVEEDAAGGGAAAVPEAEVNATSSFRYSRSVLQSTLQLMGCKPRHAFKISQRVFKMARRESSEERLASGCVGDPQHDAEVHHKGGTEYGTDACLEKPNVDQLALEEEKSKSKPFELYKRRTTAVVRRSFFLDVCCEALSEYKYVGPNQRADLALACRIRERKESVTVLLCGTSGCGKSTLSALLASRLGITTVVSTDSIRHMMRSFVDEKENPLLWASTYHAGEYLDPLAVAEAKSKREAKKSAGTSSASLSNHEALSNSTITKSEEHTTTTSDKISPKQMAVEGFKAQSEMVIDSLDRLITSWEEKKESVVVEGVHLSLNFVMGLMKKHPSIIPFMVYIASEEKHLERFAVRAKYMTLDPAKNKYVKYIRNIRTIQEYLCNRADKHLVPKVNNTNVDKSVAIIHATVFSCIRRRELGDHLYDPITNTVDVIDEEYRNQRAANSLSSEGMFQLIQRKGSTRQLMALLNNDGSVAKAWPVGMSDDNNGRSMSGHPSWNGIGTPMYGPLQIGKSEPVNLQFGHFGISAWPNDTGGTSRASSVDGSRSEMTDNGSRNVSSCCSSPRGPDKELQEEMSVNGSDEEVDELPEPDSDDDSIDGQKEQQEEAEGSVDEESNKSDEEYYDDLAMLDDDPDTDNNRVSDDDDVDFFYKTKFNDVLKVSGGEQQQPNGNNELPEDRYQQNLDLFMKTKEDHHPLMCAFASSSPLENKNTPCGNCRLKKQQRSQSIPELCCEYGSLVPVQTAKEAIMR